MGRYPLYRRFSEKRSISLKKYRADGGFFGRGRKQRNKELRDRKNRGCFGREKATACVRRENETGPRTVSENRNAGKQGFEIRNTGW